jgi:hypothetical protein
VTGITTATALAAGAAHTCALLADGTLRCWGGNLFGSLGNGTTTGPATTPVAVSGIFDAMAPMVWISSNPSIAAIDATGIATGLSPGITTVTATAANFEVSGGTTLQVPEPGPASGTVAALVALALPVARRARVIRVEAAAPAP